MAQDKKRRRLTDFITRESILLLVVVVLWKFFVYDVSRILANGKPHLSLATSLEDLFPLVLWMVWVYFGCYLFWGTNYVMSVRYDRKHAYIFAGADILGEAIAFLFFVFLPATMVRPEFSVVTPSAKLLSFLYRIDAPDNLFPSLHCFNSILSWLGIHRNHRISKTYRWFSFLFALLVCLCTLLVKQHVLVDTLAGIVLAFLCYGLSSSVVPKVLEKRGKRRTYDQQHKDKRKAL